MPVNSESTLVNELSEDRSGSQQNANAVAGSTSGPRIALISPYSGNNFGDAAILDSLIDSLRRRLPGAQFSGITFNCDHFIARHGTRAFPLCGVDRSFHCMVRAQRSGQNDGADHQPSFLAQIKSSLTRLPLIGPVFGWVRSWARNLLGELRHALRGYRFLRSHDCVIVAGGGQLDDEWGGPWGHPFALYKWTLLAKVARVPIVFASVGACKITSRWSSFFLRSALLRSSYRSYRDQNSHKMAADLLNRANRDTVVPDLAFGLPEDSMTIDRRVRDLAHSRKVIVISPMIYARPGMWPRADAAVYTRYLRELAKTISLLQTLGYFVVIVRSTYSDRNAVEELIELVDPGSQSTTNQNLWAPSIDTWKDLVAVLSQADIVIASRLHSVVLSFASNKPTIAISFDAKVDWAMSDLSQDAYRLDIREFAAVDALQAINRLEASLTTSSSHIESFNSGARSALAAQADALAALAKTRMQTTH